MSEVSPSELAEILAQGGADVIDVRTDGERAAAHIPGTRHIPFEELLAASAALDRSRPIVFYCRSGDRSGAAVQAFAASGWEASSLAGGLIAWVEDGRPVEPEGGQVVEPSAMPPA
jgi:rhodanese-related sulfurtransferase